MSTSTPTRQARPLTEWIADGLVVRVSEHDADNVTVDFDIYFAEDATAARDAFVALFPKSNKVHGSSLSGHMGNYYSAGSVLPNGEIATGNGKIISVDKITGEEIDGNDYSRSAWRLPSASVSFRLISNGVTGAKNEAAHKRLVSFLKNLNKNGISFTQKFQESANVQPELAEVIARFA